MTSNIEARSCTHESLDSHTLEFLIPSHDLNARTEEISAKACNMDMNPEAHLHMGFLGP